MKVGDLIRYHVTSSAYYNMLGIIVEISNAPSRGSIAHAKIIFQNGEEHWTNMICLEVINENR